MRSFADYDRDLAAFMKEIVLPDCQPPYIAMAHSMGGHILLRNAILPSSWFSRMVLSAPMIEIAQERLGKAAPFSRAYAETLGALGFGALYAAGGSDKPIEMGPFEGNPLTTDRERYAAQPHGPRGGSPAGARLADRRLAESRPALHRRG